MEVRYYLKRPKGSTSSIFARICYEGLQLKYYLSEHINPKHWGSAIHRAMKAKTFPEHPEFNARLDIVEHIIKDTYCKYRNDNDQKIPSPEELKDLLDIATGKTTKKQVTFFSYFKDFNYYGNRQL